MGFDEAAIGRLSIVVTECATNLWKHAAGGEMLIGTNRLGGETCIDAIALDQGPGMRDVARCFTDGFSTAGSSGGGLGAVGRLSECQVFTMPGKGTAILARVFKGSPPDAAKLGEFAAGGVSVPVAGEMVCGDGFALRQQGPALWVMMADGLGHGTAAAACADRAVETFERSELESPVALLEKIHAALRGTRGSAVSVACLDLSARKVRFAGAGNVLGMISAMGASRQFVAMPGIAGNKMACVREFTYDWPSGGVVLIYSDGIASHWSLDEYGGLAAQDPALIAAVIYRDKKRSRDDASIVAIRERSQL